MASPPSAKLPQTLNRTTRRTLSKRSNPRQGPHLCWWAGSEWIRSDLRPWRVAGLAAAAERQEEEAVHHAGSISASELLLQEERRLHPQVAARLSSVCKFSANYHFSKLYLVQKTFRVEESFTESDNEVNSWSILEMIKRSHCLVFG